MLVLMFSAVLHYFLTLYLFDVYGFIGTVYGLNITFTVSAIAMYLLSVFLNSSPSFRFDKYQQNFFNYFKEATVIAIPV